MSPPWISLRLDSAPLLGSLRGYLVMDYIIHVKLMQGSYKRAGRCAVRLLQLRRCPLRFAGTLRPDIAIYFLNTDAYC